MVYHSKGARRTGSRSTRADQAKSARATSDCRTGTSYASPLSPSIFQPGIFRKSFLLFVPTGKTASGSSFNRDSLTAAHRNLPFGTRVRVTDLASSKSVVVRITDRGPWVRGRVLDLSLGAARSVGITDRGVAQVRAEVLYLLSARRSLAARIGDTKYQEMSRGCVILR